MKISFTSIIAVLFIQHNVTAQNLSNNDTCIKYSIANTQAFIPGYKDSIISLNKAVMVVDPFSLINGFELLLKDTSYKILRFRLAFDSDCCITELASKGSRIEPRNDSIVLYNKIIEATLITIDDIFISKNSICYKVPSFVYYTLKRNFRNLKD